MKSITLQMLKNQWLFRLIGIGVLALILFRIDLSQVWRTLVSVDLRFVTLSLVLQALGLLVATLRWQLIMRRLEIWLPFSRSFVHQLIGTATALVTPGQLGEFVKVLYHRKAGFPVAESLVSVLLDRIFDVLMLLLGGLIALAILFGLPLILTLVVVASGSAVLVVGFLFAHTRAHSTRWSIAALLRVSPKKYRALMHTNTQRLAQRIGALKPDFLLSCGLLTAVNYLFLVFRVYVLVLALHLSVPFWYFAMVVPLLRLVGLIPISISGIGTRDITAIYLLGQVGVPAEASLIISMLGLITLQVQALVGVLAWWRYPLHLGQPSLSSFGQWPPVENES